MSATTLDVAAAHARANLLKDDTIGGAVRQRRLTGAHMIAAGADRFFEYGAHDRRAARDFHHDPAVDLFEESRNSRRERRPHLLHIFGDRLNIFRICYRHAPEHAGVIDVTLENVRQRQERQIDVIGAQRAFTSALGGVVTNVIAVALTLAVMLSLSWSVTLLTLALVALFPLAASAQGAKEPGPVKIIKVDLKEPISYEKHVEPMFYKRCTVCHSGNVKEGKLDLSSYDALIKGGKSGEVIKPGKGDESILYKAMARTSVPLTSSGWVTRYSSGMSSPSMRTYAST